MKTIEEFRELGGDGVKEPLEKLRFFCSLGLCSEDWIESEIFFTDLQNKFQELENRLIEVEQEASGEAEQIDMLFNENEILNAQLAESVPKSGLEGLVTSWKDRSSLNSNFNVVALELQKLLTNHKE